MGDYPLFLSSGVTLLTISSALIPNDHVPCRLPELTLSSAILFSPVYGSLAHPFAFVDKSFARRATVSSHVSAPGVRCHALTE